MMEYMEAKMQDMIEGAISDFMEYGDRVTPLLLEQAGKRGASNWSEDDAIHVIARLLAKIDAMEGRNK